MMNLKFLFYPKRLKKGFNLIEAAIVLGVVGLVIGGIWVAAAAIKSTRISNQQKNGMLVINQNIRELYQGQDISGYIRLDLDTNILLLIIRGADGFSVATTLSGSSYLISPMNTRQNLRIHNSQIVWDFAQTALQPEDCIRLISSITAAAPKTIYAVLLSSTNYYTFPINPTAAQCAGGLGNIWFKF